MDGTCDGPFMCSKKWLRHSALALLIATVIYSRTVLLVASNLDLA